MYLMKRPRLWCKVSTDIKNPDRITDLSPSLVHRDVASLLTKPHTEVYTERFRYMGFQRTYDHPYLPLHSHEDPKASDDSTGSLQPLRFLLSLHSDICVPSVDVKGEEWSERLDS